VKITTWNVNGLRSVFTKGSWDQLKAQDPDVICLQEIKTRPEQLDPNHQLSLAGYHCVWNPAEKPGYSGVATCSRPEPVEVRLGMNSPAFDGEGRVIQTKYPSLRLFNVYFPNGKRDLGRLQYKLDFYATLLDLLMELNKAGEKVVICGDFNTAHREIDLRHPKANALTSGFLPEERIWIDKYLASGFVDPFRVLYPDRVQYTWWTYITNARQKNVGWRIDYFLISESLMPQVVDVITHEEILGSDHCPVSLLLE
jgi:exodeoxyribonuclease-3